MAKHTFVTASHTTWDETKTVEILSRTDVRKVVLEVIGREAEDLADKIKVQERKLAKVSEQAAATAKDAAAAHEAVTRLVETARESFRTVIEEMLEPHYRTLAEHLGVKAPIKPAKPKTARTAKSESVSAKAAKGKAGTPSKAVNRKAASSPKEVASSKAKGIKPCRKK